MRVEQALLDLGPAAGATLRARSSSRAERFVQRVAAPRQQARRASASHQWPRVEQQIEQIGAARVPMRRVAVASRRCVEPVAANAARTRRRAVDAARAASARSARRRRRCARCAIQRGMPSPSRTLGAVALAQALEPPRVGHRRRDRPPRAVEERRHRRQARDRAAPARSATGAKARVISAMTPKIASPAASDGLPR